MDLAQSRIVTEKFEPAMPAVDELRQPHKLIYRIITLCRADFGDYVERFIKRQLANWRIGMLDISRELQNQGMSARISVRIECTVPERAALVRLVNRLDLEQGVRRVRWESVPMNCRARAVDF
jgi:uncharacterized membrane protein YhiD involved in acid resistance